MSLRVLTGGPAATPGRVATPARAVARGRIAEHTVVGMGLFVFAEIMLFAGFIAGFIITERSAVPGTWTPDDQPRLPVVSTAFNTAALLASGVLLFLASRAHRRGDQRSATWLMGLSLVLGALFVGLQGREWVQLLAHGLTLTSSPIGSYFYLIVGAHALHAVVALVYLGFVWFWLRAGRLTSHRFAAAQLFWYFVVLLWPCIYLKVYL